MLFKRFVGSLLLTTLTLLPMAINAGNLDAQAARVAANTFIHHQQTTASFRTSALNDLKLAHAEPSSMVKGAFDYYIFNIDGGGFVIVAGEDRAMRVLGYSNTGHIDFNQMPAPLKDLLDSYKSEIEFLRCHHENQTRPVEPTFNAAAAGVGPLIKTTWGQEMPYYLQCPVYQGEYCVVGCVATAMAQVMNYWHYPTSLSSFDQLYCAAIGQYASALPSTTFDYSKMLDSYCHWDWDNSVLVQDIYTDAQAQEVAKLCRYCGQSVRMSYSPNGSGAYTGNQLTAMKNFGYSNARRVTKSSFQNSASDWESLLKSELDAGRPMLYTANDPSAGSHSFICDGYDGNGLFHFNLGWYGTCDGYYATSALNMLHRNGDQLNFTSSHEIIYNLEIPDYSLITADDVKAESALAILGGTLNTEASNVSIKTSYNSINFVFALTDGEGNRIATGEAVNQAKSGFEQGSNVKGSVVLPNTLSQDTYFLQLNYFTTSENDLFVVNSSKTLVHVVGHIAKFGKPFDIDDVTIVIYYLLNNPTSGSNLDIDDITALINHLLS